MRVDVADVGGLQTGPLECHLHRLRGTETCRVGLGDVVVTSTKSMTGHLLGAAGALESIATVLALTHRVVPPTINVEHQDAEVLLDIATEPRKLDAEGLAALNNSFGFGGHNVAIAFRSA